MNHFDQEISSLRIHVCYSHPSIEDEVVLEDGLNLYFALLRDGLNPYFASVETVSLVRNQVSESIMYYADKRERFQPSWPYEKC